MFSAAALNLFGVGAFTVLLSFLFTGAATVYARRRGLMDHPGARHSHQQATPRGGGAGLVLAWLLMSFVCLWGALPEAWLVGIFPGACVLALTGWWDDHASPGVLPRLLLQAAAAAWLVGFGMYAGWITSPLYSALCLFGVLWTTNLYNFMDGSNGMAGLQGVFSSLVLAGLFSNAGDSEFAMLAIVLAASCAGFLPWNLLRTKVFMGDVGSLTLGFVFAALLLYGTGTGAFSMPVALMVMALFVVDASLTLAWRVFRGERWYNAHRQHLYQRMIECGWTHGGVAAMYQGVNLILILPGIVVAMKIPALAWTMFLAVAVILVLGWHMLIRSYKELAQAG